jgi:hypothetical protein
MNLRKRRTEASERFAERRRREEEAPRLRERVPDLVTLELQVEESQEATGVAGSMHKRHIIVERAPALFVIPCGDPSCDGGGYDITDKIMRGLQSHTDQFEADDRCLGSVGTVSCKRLLHVKARATYR